MTLQKKHYEQKLIKKLNEYIKALKELTINNNIYNKLNNIDWIKDTGGIVLNNSFEGLILLAKFILPNSVTSISDRAFSGSTLPQGFIISNNSKDMPYQIFKNVVV